MAKKSNYPISVWVGILVAIPLIGVFLFSLAAATVVGALALGAYYLLRAPVQPLPRRRPTPDQYRHPDEIELAPGDYRRLPNRPNDGAS